jgi:3-phosphoshikimate 1-carboxyvinyltransferase
MDRRFEPAGPLQGSLKPPPDKSISHRAALIAAMGEGETRIEGYLDAADTRSTLAAAAALGAGVDTTEGEHGSLTVEVEGVGLSGAGSAELDVGNAGTLLRVLPGWLAGQQGSWTLDGDESIRRRPVDRVAEPLRRMGAEVDCRDGRLPPLRVRGAELEAIEYELPVASAQVKSCVLLAGLQAEGETTVIESQPTRDHTERMLEAAGAQISSEGGRISVLPLEGLSPERFAVPGDFSSAAFALAGAAVVPESDLVVEAVGVNPTRTGLLTVLERMGAELHVGEDPDPGPEPTGAVHLRCAELEATEVGGDEVALTIDELPLVALVACFAEGETVIRDAAELRHKESDRIAAVCDGLAGLGAEIEPSPDGLIVRGTEGLRGGTLDARGDHRMAMLGAIAGLASLEGVVVRGFEAAEVSYPDFEDALGSLIEA